MKQKSIRAGSLSRKSRLVSKFRYLEVAAKYQGAGVWINLVQAEPKHSRVSFVKRD
jgi:hypothetical protein